MWKGRLILWPWPSYSVFLGISVLCCRMGIVYVFTALKLPWGWSGMFTCMDVGRCSVCVDCPHRCFTQCSSSFSPPVYSYFCFEAQLKSHLPGDYLRNKREDPNTVVLRWDRVSSLWHDDPAATGQDFQVVHVHTLPFEIPHPSHVAESSQICLPAHREGIRTANLARQRVLRLRTVCNFLSCPLGQSIVSWSHLDATESLPGRPGVQLKTLLLQHRGRWDWRNGGWLPSPGHCRLLLICGPSFSSAPGCHLPFLMGKF